MVHLRDQGGFELFDFVEKAADAPDLGPGTGRDHHAPRRALRDQRTGPHHGSPVAQGGIGGHRGD